MRRRLGIPEGSCVFRGFSNLPNPSAMSASLDEDESRILSAESEVPLDAGPVFQGSVPNTILSRRQQVSQQR